MLSTLWTTIKTELKTLHEDERGQGLMEYAVMFIVLAALVVAAVTLIGGGLSAMSQRAVDAMP